MHYNFDHYLKKIELSTLQYVVILTAVAVSAINVNSIANQVLASEHEGEINHQEHTQYGEELYVNVKVVMVPTDGHLSTCIVGSDFELCNERDITTQDIVQVIELETGYYHVPEYTDFDVCVDVRGYDGKHYHQCDTLTNNANGNPEFTTIELEGTRCH